MKLRGLVIDRSNTEILFQPATLVLAASDADDFAAVDLCNLADLRIMYRSLQITERQEPDINTSFARPVRDTEVAGSYAQLTVLPTAPAAPETTTISPGLIFPTSKIPQYAV